MNAFASETIKTTVSSIKAMNQHCVRVHFCAGRLLTHSVALEETVWPESLNDSPSFFLSQSSIHYRVPQAANCCKEKDPPYSSAR